MKKNIRRISPPTEFYFKESLLMYLNENRMFALDFRFNVTLEDEDESDLRAGKYEITASRATFQHVYLANTTVQVQAMDELKNR